MRRILVLGVEFFISKRIHIWFLAYVSVIFYARCIGMNTYNPLIPFVSAFLVWAAYLENLVTDVKEDRFNGNVPHGISSLTEACLFRIERFYPLIYGLALILAWLVNWKCFVAVLIGNIVLSSYVQCWFPVRGSLRRLKEIYIVKNIIPPIGWLIAVVVVPFVSVSRDLAYGHIIFGLMYFLMGFREEIKFDIPDTAGDLQAGIKTFPNVLGETETRRLLDFINCGLLLLVFLAVLMFFEYGPYESLRGLLMNIFPLLMAFSFDRNYTDALFNERKKEYCNVGIVWWVLLLIVFMLVPYPYNILVYIVLRFLGNLLALPVFEQLIRRLRSSLDAYASGGR